MFPLRLSTPQIEGTLRVSKALKHQVLLDDNEMRELVDALGTFSFYNIGEVVNAETAIISSATFLAHYAEYVRALKEGRVPDETKVKRYVSAALSVTPDLFYGMQVGENKFLVKPLKPVVQMQLHQFFISDLDEKFHPMVLGKDSVAWGIQFSYPQVFQDPKTHEYHRIRETEEFPNTALFLKLSRWLRRATIPTPFIYKGKKVNVPIRIGKQCLSWIHLHPQLQARGLSVCVDKH
jgi:hypothetical protein